MGKKAADDAQKQVAEEQKTDATKPLNVTRHHDHIIARMPDKTFELRTLDGKLITPFVRHDFAMQGAKAMKFGGPDALQKVLADADAYEDEQAKDQT